jgi:hypothetical protein
VIVDPINDVDCLGQLTVFARELAGSTLIRSVAAHLGTRELVILWLRSLPQSDDFGDENVRFIQCDVPQRTRVLPDDPNCVERALGALMLLEAIDPKIQRALATVDKPLRHTGIVELVDGHWRAVDLFPRRNAQRNFSWADLSTPKGGKQTLHSIHQQLGTPILKYFLGAKLGGDSANALGGGEDWLVEKIAPEKKPAPPHGVPQRVVEQPKSKPQPARTGQLAPKSGGFDFGQLASVAQGIAAGANQQQQSNPFGGGERNGQEEKGPRGARADDDDDGNEEAEGGDRALQPATGSNRDPHEDREKSKRFWGSLRW